MAQLCGLINGLEVSGVFAVYRAKSGWSLPAEGRALGQVVRCVCVLSMSSCCGVNNIVSLLVSRLTGEILKITVYHNYC